MAPDTTPQKPDEEQRVLENMCARLAEDFPDIPGPVVREAAARALTGLADAKVREFLEIFAQRDAAALLAAFSSPEYAPPLPRLSEAT